MDIWVVSRSRDRSPFTEALCTATVLGYLWPGEKFIVDTDSINMGIGGVLSQVPDGSEWVAHCLTSPDNCVQWQLVEFSKVVLRVTRPRIRLRVIHPFITSRFHCFKQFFVYPLYYSTVLQFIHSTTQWFTNLHIYIHSLTHSLLRVST